MATKAARTEILRMAAKMLSEATHSNVDGGVKEDEAVVSGRRRAALARYADFAYESPLLFETLLKDGRSFDMAGLTFMMSQIDAVALGHMTGDDAEKSVVHRLTTPQSTL